MSYQHKDAVCVLNVALDCAGLQFGCLIRAATHIHSNPVQYPDLVSSVVSEVLPDVDIHGWPGDGTIYWYPTMVSSVGMQR